VELMTNASRMLAESNRTDAAHWYFPWATRFVQSRNKTAYWSSSGRPGRPQADADPVSNSAQQASSPSLESPGNAQDQTHQNEKGVLPGFLGALDQQIDQVAARLEMTQVHENAESDARFAQQSLDIAEVAATGLASRRRWLFSDLVEKIEVDRTSERPAAHPGRLLTAILLLGVACLALPVCRRTDWDRWLRPAPPLLGVLGGLIWWFWLTPSILGLLYLLVSLVGLAFSIRRWIVHRRLATEAG
jgi:hypothetical protein